MYSAWKANAIGRSSKTVREFWRRITRTTCPRTRLSSWRSRACWRFVQTGAKNIEIALMEGHGKVRNVELAEIEKFVEEINAEKEAEAEEEKPSCSDGRCAQASMS